VKLASAVILGLLIVAIGAWVITTPWFPSGAATGPLVVLFLGAPNRLFFPLIALGYAIMFGMTAYFHFFP
jgi:hypothetical protein